MRSLLTPNSVSAVLMQKPTNSPEKKFTLLVRKWSVQMRSVRLSAPFDPPFIEDKKTATKKRANIDDKTLRDTDRQWGRIRECPSGQNNFWLFSEGSQIKIEALFDDVGICSRGAADMQQICSRGAA